MTQTTIAAGSAGASLPQAIVNVASTAGFLPGPNSIRVLTSLGLQLVAYTGLSGTSFTVCSGGLGVMSLGGANRLVVYLMAYPFASSSTVCTLHFPSVADSL